MASQKAWLAPTVRQTCPGSIRAAYRVRYQAQTASRTSGSPSSGV